MKDITYYMYKFSINYNSLLITNNFLNFLFRIVLHSILIFLTVLKIIHVKEHHR